MHRTSRLGFVLFAAYLVLYGGFVGVVAFSPRTMEAIPFAGVNLAVVWGFGLIVAAIGMSLAYGVLSGRGPSGGDGPRKGEGA